MKLIRTIVFILLFAIVMAIYLFQVRLNKQVLKILPDEVNRTVLISEVALVVRVELRDNIQKTKIVLRKKNGIWSLAEPVRYPAESQIVEGFLTAARMASQQSRLRAEKEWGEYGLAKPEFEILFDMPGKKTAILRIGAQAPVGKAVFARWSDERGFFLLPPEMKAMFRQSVYSLRQKRLFRTSTEDIRKIYVEMGKYSCQWKREGDQWYWLEPVEKLGQKVSAGSMELVLGGLQSLHAREFLDHNKKSKSELGFFMIHDFIRLELEGGKKETFYFGNEVPEQNAYYGFLEGEDVVFLVDRLNVVEFFDFMRKIQAEAPKLETKDLSSKPIAKSQ